MTATVEARIWQALKARIKALDTSYAMDWPASAFDKPKTARGVLKPYIEVRLFLNQMRRVLITSDGAMERPGILQMTLCYPVALGHSFEQMQQQAALIAAQFGVDDRLVFDGVTVRITQAPDVAQPLRDDAYWRYPISVRWRCFG